MAGPAAFSILFSISRCSANWWREFRRRDTTSCRWRRMCIERASDHSRLNVQPKRELREGGRLPQKRTNVLADPGGHFDVEAGFRRDLEGLSGGVIRHGGLAIERHPAGAGDDFHPLCLVGAKMELARVDQ